MASVWAYANSTSRGDRFQRGQLLLALQFLLLMSQLVRLPAELPVSGQQTGQGSRTGLPELPGNFPGDFLQPLKLSLEAGERIDQGVQPLLECLEASVRVLRAGYNVVYLDNVAALDPGTVHNAVHDVDVLPAQEQPSARLAHFIAGEGSFAFFNQSFQLLNISFGCR